LFSWVPGLSLLSNNEDATAALLSIDRDAIAVVL
jgi:hypothetical protein